MPRLQWRGVTGVKTAVVSNFDIRLRPLVSAFPLICFCTFPQQMVCECTFGPVHTSLLDVLLQTTGLFTVVRQTAGDIFRRMACPTSTCAHLLPHLMSCPSKKGASSARRALQLVWRLVSVFSRTCLVNDKARAVV